MTVIKLYSYSNTEKTVVRQNNSAALHWGVDSNCNDGDDYYNDAGADSLTVMMIVAVVTTTIMLVLTH